MIGNNQSAPGAIVQSAFIVATYWPYVGTTTACALNKAVAVDTISGGAYSPAGTARASLAATPAYTNSSGAADPRANVCYIAAASVAAQRQSVVAVLVESKGAVSTQVSAGETGRFVVNGDVLVSVRGYADDATSTGTAISIGTLLTLDGNSGNLGGFRPAASGEIVKARCIGSSASLGTSSSALVASTASGTVLVELMGDSLAKA
jgi:hypothetical protein